MSGPADRARREIDDSRVGSGGGGRGTTRDQHIATAQVYALLAVADALNNIAATQSTASAEDRAATTGRVNASHLVGEGPHDATSSPCGGAAEGTLPAPGNPPHAPRVLP